MNPIMGMLMANDWSMSTFLENSDTMLESWGVIIVGIVGLVMVIVGVVKLAMGLTSSGRGQTNWFMTIALIVLGAILAFAGGWDLVQNLGAGAKDTIYSLGEDVIFQGLGIFR